MPPKRKQHNDDAYSADVKTVKSWIESNGKADAIDKTFSSDGKKHTMLYRACRLGRFDIAKMLVDDYGADVNLTNGGEDKSVPLHGACYGGSPPCVALLVHNGANVDSANAYGETPLDNAKAPAEGVKKAFSAKCQKLMQDKAASTQQLKVATENMEKVKEITGTTDAAATTPAAVGSKTKASTAEAEDDGKPAAKKKAGAATATGPHPLSHSVVVLSGTFKSKKSVLEARVAEFGGKVTGSVSGQTTHLVTGKNAGSKEHDAIFRGVPVWTEEEFEATCKTGIAPPPKPVPTILQGLVHTTRLEESYRKALISTLTYLMEKESGSPTLFFYGAKPAKGYAPPVGSFGADLIAPIITGWPGNFILLSSAKLQNSDVKHVMDAIVARDASLTPMRILNMGGNKDVTDEGAMAVAEALPKTTLSKIYLYGANLSKVGVHLLLKALEQTPSMNCLEIQHIPGAKEVYDEWKQDSGANCKCHVLVE